MKQTKTAALFKKLVDDGKYTEGHFMCVSLLDYTHNGIMFWRIPSTTKAKKELKLFMEQLVENAYMAYEGIALSTCLRLHFLKSYGKYISESDTIDLCLLIYSDWDNRWNIVNYYMVP